MKIFKKFRLTALTTIIKFYCWITSLGTLSFNILLNYFAAGTTSSSVIKNINAETRKPLATICTIFRAEPTENPTKIALTLGLQLMLFCKSIL